MPTMRAHTASSEKKIMADEVARKRRRRKEFFCPHCSSYVSKSTLYHHKSLYNSDGECCHAPSKYLPA